MPLHLALSHHTLWTPPIHLVAVTFWLFTLRLIWQCDRLVFKPPVFSIATHSFEDLTHSYTSHLAQHCLSATLPSCLFLTSSQVRYEHLSQVLSLSCSEPTPASGLHLTPDKGRVLSVAHEVPHSLSPSPACPHLPVTRSAQPNKPVHLRPFTQALCHLDPRISMFASTLQVFAQMSAFP